MCQFKLQICGNVMASKRKHFCYNAAFKLKVVDFAEENGNRAAEHKFIIFEKLV